MNTNKMQNIFLRTILLLLILVGFKGQCQHFYIEKTPRDSAINALLQIKSNIEEVHPNPYHSMPKAHIDFTINAAIKELPDSLNEIELYRLLLPFVNQYNDGHIQLKCPFGKFINQAINMDKGIFPLTLYELNGSSFVKHSIFDSIVKPGYHLISIDNVSIDTIIKKYSRYKFGDNLQIRKRKAIEDFTVLAYFDGGSRESYTIGYKKDCYSEVQHTRIPAAKKEDIVRYNQSYTPSSPKKYFSNPVIKMDQLIYLQIHPKRRIALLTLPCFDVSTSMEQEYANKIDSAYQYLLSHGIDTLLIDIRENQGGRDFPGTHILKHMATRSYSYGDALMKVSTHQQKLYKEILKEKLSDSLYIKSTEYHNFFLRKHGELFALNRDTTQEAKPEDLYTGKTFLLIGKKTFSAAVSFAAVCKCYQFATLIGEETDGQLVTYTSLIPTPIPIQGIWFGVAHRKVINACASNSPGGLKPDVLVKPTHESFLSDFDEVIEFILKK
ncbi:MAG: hypothetical protein JW783_02675 [Bacteroidales bacterium]|nr:hypothetical protein [Bacteroidales bacterium]MBN2748212.1 hypothetical protein [Bacteroidales bacterium]